MLTEEHHKKIEELRKRYPTSQSLVLPVLWMVQEQEGYISEEAMREVAQVLDVPFKHILGVVTFYTMLKSKRVGKHHIEICTNISCMLRGSQALLEHLERRLGIHEGDVSSDGRWSIEEVECMGACGNAPMIALGERYYENLTTEKLDALIDSLS